MLRFLPGWQQLCGSKLRRNLKPRFRVDSRRRHPALELLEERAMLSVAQDIQNAIAPYQAALNTALDTATSLPLVGKQFKDLQELDTLLTNALDKIAAQTQNITSGHFQLAIPLTTISHTFTFNLGLDAFMQVSTSGGVTASVTPVLNVGFNYDGTTATLDKANTNIDIGFGLSLPDFQATMSFNGLLYTHAVDMGTNFQGHLAFGFNTGDNGVSAHFSGDAHIRLGLTMSFVDPALHASYNPIFKTNFELDWGFNPQSNVLAAPHIALKNFSIDVDSFMHGFLGDIVTTVQKYTKPLQPFIDMFNTPVPIISAFDSSETMGDLLLKGASLTEDQQDRFKLMVKIITVLNTFDLSGSTGGATLNFGDINIGVTDITNASGFNIDTSQLTGVIDDIFNSPALQDVQDTLESVANYTGLTSSAGFKFQVLENPGDVIGGILTGQTKTMFSYDTGREHFDAAASVGVGIPDVIGLFLQAGITFDAQLSMGYDTAGLTKFAREDPQHKPEDLLHGFYFDNSIDTSGPPIPNVSSPRKTALYLQGFAGVKATLLLANVTGGIHANLSVELASADSSSHVHLDDMIQNLASHAKVFKISGQVYAAATIDISLDTVVGPDITFFSYELAKDVLIDFDPPPAPTFSVPLVVIDVTGQHTLTLDPSKMPPGSSVTVQPFHDFTITSAGTFVGDGIRVDYASEIDLYVERKDDTNTNYYNLVGVNGAVPDGVSITVIDPFRVFADEGAVSPAPGQTRPGVVLAGGKNVHYKYVGAADGSLAHVLLAGGYGSSTLAGGTMEFGNFIPAARLDQAKQHFGDMSGFDAAGVALINSRIDGDVAPASPAGIIGSTMSASRGGLMLGGPGANSFIATGAGSYEMIGGPWVDTFSISPSFAGVPATYAIDAGGGDSDSLVVRVPAGENVTFENATVADRYTPSFKALAVQANAGLSATAHGVRKVRIIATSGSTVTLGDTSELNVDFSITGGGHIIFGGTNAPDVFNVSTSGSYYDRKNHFTVQKYGFDEDGVLHYPGNYGIILPSRMADPIYSITRTFGTNGRTQTIPFAVADNFGSAIELNAGGASDAYSITMGVAAFVDVTVNDTDTSTQNAVTVNVRDSNLVNNIVTLTDNALLLDYYTAVVFHDLIHVGTVNQGGYVSSFASSVHYQTSVHFNGNNNITFASGAAFLQTNVNRSAAAVAASIVIDNQSYRSFIPFESFGAVSGLVFDGTLPIPYFVTLPATHSLDVQANAGNLTIQKNAPSAPPETFNVYENTGTLSIQVSRNWNVDFDTFNVISNAGSVTIDNRINASIGGSSFITGLNSVTNVAANFGVINVQDTLAAGLINIALDSQVNIGNGSLRDVHGTINLSNSNGHFGLNLDDRTNTGAGRLWTVSSQQTTIGDLTVNYPGVNLPAPYADLYSRYQAFPKPSGATTLISDPPFYYRELNGSSFPNWQLQLPYQNINRDTETVSVAVSIVGNAGGSVTYGASDLPPGLSINASTGVITGTIQPNSHRIEPYLSSVTATAGGVTRTATTYWYVSSAIDIISPPTYFSGHEGDVESYGPFTTTNVSNRPVTLSASGLPAGLTFNANTASIIGTIALGAAQNSPYHINIHATDGIETADYSFDWYVTGITLTQLTNQVSHVGDNVNVAVHATTASGAALVFHATGLPDGLSINANTGLITGTPTGAGVQSFYSAITATNGNDSAGFGFTWSIVPAGISNYILVGNPGTQTSHEGDNSGFLAPNAYNSLGLPVTYAATGLPPGLSLTLGDGSYYVSGFIDAGAATGSPYHVHFTATDGLWTGTAAFDWNVLPAGGTVHIYNVGPQYSLVNDSFSLDLSPYAYSDLGEPLTYSASGLPSGLSINSQTGVISGAILPQAALPHAFQVTMTATAASGSDTKTFLWNVYSSYDLPNIATLPSPTGGTFQVSSPVGTTLMASVSPSAGIAPPGGVAFPFGYLTFTINSLTPGAAADLTISGLNLNTITDYYKYGATPANSADHWYNFLFGRATDGDSAIGTGLEIVGGNIVLHLVDGGRGDDDLAKNGAIFDIGGPAKISTVQPPQLPGDYNINHSVDAADYVLWRKTVSQTVAVPYSGADGSGDAVVNQADYGVWRAHFGQSTSGSGAEETFAARQQSITGSGAESLASATTTANVELIQSSTAGALVQRERPTGLLWFSNAELSPSDHVLRQTANAAIQTDDTSTSDLAILTLPASSYRGEQPLVSDIDLGQRSSDADAYRDDSEVSAVDDAFATLATSALRQF